MKRGFILLVLVMGLVAAHGVSAHVLATDGTIGAVMHTDPDDEAIAGEPAGFFLEFKDTTEKFKLQDCTCTMSLEKDGQTFFSQPLSAAMQYTFAKPGVYQLVVTGAPMAGASFSPFTLRYDVQVVAGAVPVTGGSWLSTHVLHVIGTIILVVVTLGMIIYERIRPTAA